MKSHLRGLVAVIVEHYAAQTIADQPTADPVSTFMKNIKIIYGQNNKIVHNLFLILFKAKPLNRRTFNHISKWISDVELIVRVCIPRTCKSNII